MEETLKAWLTPVIAGLTILIAIVQYTLARRQWLVGLYDKRHPVFIATMKFLGGVARDARVTEEALGEFLRESRDHWLLFGEDVDELLGMIYKKGVRLRFVEQKRKAGKGTEEKLIELAEEDSDLVEWMVGQIDETKKVFGRYLKVGKRGKVWW